MTIPPLTSADRKQKTRCVVAAPKRARPRGRVGVVRDDTGRLVRGPASPEDSSRHARLGANR